MLNNHTEINIGKELLQHKLKRYPSFMAKEARQSNSKLWGFKVVTQMVKRQVNLGEPNQVNYFLDILKKSKAKIIFIERENLLKEALNI